MAGLLTRPGCLLVLITVATSSAVVLSPYWAVITWWTFCLKCWNHFAKARALRPEPLAEHDAGFGLTGFRCHCFFSLIFFPLHISIYAATRDFSFSPTREKYCLRPKTNVLNGMPSAP